MPIAMVAAICMIATAMIIRGRAFHLLSMWMRQA
jgi:hypothetical protein